MAKYPLTRDDDEHARLDPPVRRLNSVGLGPVGGPGLVDLVGVNETSRC